MKNLKSMLPFWILILLGFYVLPFAIKDTGMGMLVLLFGLPMLCFICSVVFGVKNGFSFIFSAVVGLLFIPSLFIFYNESAWVYVIMYLGISLVGNLIGMIFYKRK